MIVIKNIVISEEAPNLKEVGWLQPLNDGTFKLKFYGSTGWSDAASGIKGGDGATFTPSVDNDGNISWTNGSGLPNPPTKNIKGNDGAYPTAIALTVDDAGKVTGGTATLSNGNSLPITVSQS